MITDTSFGSKKTEVPVRLLEFSIQDLFGEFNHTIQLKPSERVTSIIGPNGVGKTACLRLINALFRSNWAAFQTTDFAMASFRFSDGSFVTVDKIIPSENETDSSDTLGIRFLTQRPTADGGIATEAWFPRPYQEPSKTRMLEGYLPFLTRVNSKIWINDSTRQTLSLHEVLETYGDRIPDSVRNSLAEQPTGWLAQLCSQIDCHLIETQRLLVFLPDEGRRYAPSAAPSTLAISRKAQILKGIIERELARYGAASQSLDRSFPRRALQHHADRSAPDLTADLAELDKERKGLVDAGILAAEPDDVLPPYTTMDDAIAKVLHVYVEDTRQKLAVLSRIRDHIKLFIELIGGRLKPKTVHVDKASGFFVQRRPGSTVPLEKLSSGEQHQLVLFFELIFELKSNALILIDEPELSLHVAWQKQFIRDLQKIIELNRFDVILATHSPQLIGAWPNTVVDLGEVDL